MHSHRTFSQAEHVTSVAIAPAGNYVVSGGTNQSLRVWGFEQNNFWPELSCVQVLDDPRPVPAKQRMTGIAFFSETEEFVASYNQNLAFWQMPAIYGTASYICRKNFNTGSPITSVITLDGSRYVVTTHPAGQTEDRSLQVWDFTDMDTPLLSSSLAAHNKGTQCVFQSADNYSLISGGLDNKIKVWDLSNKMQMSNELSGHGAPISCITSTSDGICVISASEDHTVKAWDLRQPTKCIREWQGHRDTVTSVKVALNNAYIISGGRDNQIKVWSWQDLKELVSLNEHTKEVNCLAVTQKQNDMFFISGSADQTLKVWMTADIMSALASSSSVDSAPATAAAAAFTPQPKSVSPPPLSQTLHVSSDPVISPVAKPSAKTPRNESTSHSPKMFDSRPQPMASFANAAAAAASTSASSLFPSSSQGLGGSVGSRKSVDPVTRANVNTSQGNTSSPAMPAAPEAKIMLSLRKYGRNQ